MNKPSLTQEEIEKKRAALAEIGKLLDVAYKAIADAEKIADKADVCFDFSVAYGMGGSYWPTGGDGEWHSSSEGC